mmetsp:Transcript_9993/g.28852  ORF Transcript_9993/g.28852 Transcript_9993/m.28852 type:complete len:212 (-) Transcript_9993:1333-1968(-)
MCLWPSGPVVARAAAGVPGQVHDGTGPQDGRGGPRDGQHRPRRHPQRPPTDAPHQRGPAGEVQPPPVGQESTVTTVSATATTTLSSLRGASRTPTVRQDSTAAVVSARRGRRAVTEHCHDSVRTATRASRRRDTIHTRFGLSGSGGHRLAVAVCLSGWLPACVCVLLCVRVLWCAVYVCTYLSYFVRPIETACSPDSRCWAGCLECADFCN